MSDKGDSGWCILLPGGRLFFDKDGRYSFTRVGAALRVMFPGAAFQGIPTRLPLRGNLQARLIPADGQRHLHGDERV